MRRQNPKGLLRLCRLASLLWQAGAARAMQTPAAARPAVSEDAAQAVREDDGSTTTYTWELTRK